MSSAFGDLNGNGNQQIWINCYRTGQDYGANRTDFYGEVRYYGNGWGTWGANINWSANFGGHYRNGSRNIPYAERNQQYHVLLSFNFSHYHNGDGFLNGFQADAYISSDHTSVGSGGVAVWEEAAPRIPKPPRAPGISSISNITPTSARVNGIVPDDMGSGIQEWNFQAALDSGFTQGLKSLSHNGPVLDIGDLTPGNTWYFRLAARNGMGWSGWSGTASAYVGLAAPTFTSFAQNSTGGLVARWTPPSVTTGLTGYRVQVSTNANFTENVRQSDFGNITTGTLTGLPGGRRYWARVAALTAGGANAYSDLRDTMLILDSGDIDGWTRVGTKPANVAYYTAAGLRRGTVGNSQALFLESLSTGAATLATDTFGIQRTVPTVVGKAYRLTAVAALTEATSVDVYRLTGGSIQGATATVTTAPAALPAVEFVASATTSTIRVMLAEAVNLGGATEVVERLSVFSVKLEELNTDYPQRLRNTVYESDLSNHFDLACNSVGASWYVAKDGVTRFRLPGDSLPVSAVFADTETPGALSWVDIVSGFDNRSTVNRIEATNYGIDADGEVEENDELIVEDLDSQDINGVYRTTLAVNLHDEAPYTDAFQRRLTGLLNEYKTPRPKVDTIRWNAQEDVDLAVALEVGQRITVLYRGRSYDCQIVNINHDLQPTRWMVTLNLQLL